MLAGMGGFGKAKAKAREEREGRYGLRKGRGEVAAILGFVGRGLKVVGGGGDDCSVGFALGEDDHTEISDVSVFRRVESQCAVLAEGLHPSKLLDGAHDPDVMQRPASVFAALNGGGGFGFYECGVEVGCWEDGGRG